MGKAGIDDIIMKSKNQYLDVIPAGPLPPNPSELLSENQLTLLIEELKQRYDYIIVDTSPVGVVADILPLAKLFDATLIIVRKKSTKKLGLSWVLNEVSEYGFKGIGIILNNINPKDRKLGYGYGAYKIDHKRNRLKS